MKYIFVLLLFICSNCKSQKIPLKTIFSFLDSSFIYAENTLTNKGWSYLFEDKQKSNDKEKVTAFAGDNLSNKKSPYFLLCYESVKNEKIYKLVYEFDKPLYLSAPLLIKKLGFKQDAITTEDSSITKSFSKGTTYVFLSQNIVNSGLIYKLSITSPKALFSVKKPYQ